VILVLAAWLFWPRSGPGGAAASGAAGVRWETSPTSIAPAGESPGDATGASGAPAQPAGVTRTATAPATRASASATAGHGLPSTTSAHPTSPAASESPAPSTTATTKQLTSPGGTVQATCPAATTAQILSAAPTSPYKVLSLDTAAGPAPTAVFKHGKVRVTMTVSCDAGVPAKTNSVS
jgi:serine/threonine-protein kinase